MQNSETLNFKICINVQSTNEENVFIHDTIKDLPADIETYTKNEDFVILTEKNAGITYVQRLTSNFPNLKITYEAHNHKYSKFMEKGHYQLKDRKECRIILENCKMEMEDVKCMMEKFAGTRPTCRIFLGTSRRIIECLFNTKEEADKVLQYGPRLFNEKGELIYMSRYHDVEPSFHTLILRGMTKECTEEDLMTFFRNKGVEKWFLLKPRENFIDGPAAICYFKDIESAKKVANMRFANETENLVFSKISQRVQTSRPPPLRDFLATPPSNAYKANSPINGTTTDMILAQEDILSPDANNGNEIARMESFEMDSLKNGSQEINNREKIFLFTGRKLRDTAPIQYKQIEKVKFFSVQKKRKLTPAMASESHSDDIVESTDI